MPRLHKPRVSPLEHFLNRASQAIPSNLHPHYVSATPNNNPATALLNTLSPTDVLHLRLVSKSIHDWTNARLEDLFSTLYYTITIRDQQKGTIVRTPTALAPLRTIGRSCTHFVITILSPSPPSIPTSTPTPQPPSTSTLPKPASHPQLLTNLLTHLITHLLPDLHTLTLSLPDPCPWRPAPTTHSTLIYVRQALESLPPTTGLKTLNLNPISLVHLLSLRWRGLSAYGGEAGWTGARFWMGVRALDVGIYVPLEVCGRGIRSGRGGGGSGRGKMEDDDGDREVREGHVRMAIKVLHDWLAGFGRGLEAFGFEWLALPEEEEGSGNDGSIYGRERHDDRSHSRSGGQSLEKVTIEASSSSANQHSDNALPPTRLAPEPEPEPETTPEIQIRGPNPLTLHLNPTPFSFSFFPFPSSSLHHHQHQTQNPHPTITIQTSTSTSTQQPTTNPTAPKRKERFSAPPIRWENLLEIWLRGVETDGLATWMGEVGRLKRVRIYVWEEGDGEGGEEEEGGRWVCFDGEGVSGRGEGEGEEVGFAIEGGGDGEGEGEGKGEGKGEEEGEEGSVDVRFVLEE